MLIPEDPTALDDLSLSSGEIAMRLKSALYSNRWWLGFYSW
jgi:hypothetical protein